MDKPKTIDILTFGGEDVKCVRLSDYEELERQLADKHQLFMCASANYDRLAEHLVFANDQITELQRERDELEVALKQFAECDLNDSNCASLEVATRRIRSLAQTALAKVGADKGEV